MLSPDVFFTDSDVCDSQFGLHKVQRSSSHEGKSNRSFSKKNMVVGKHVIIVSSILRPSNLESDCQQEIVRDTISSMAMTPSPDTNSIRRCLHNGTHRLLDKQWLVSNVHTYMQFSCMLGKLSFVGRFAFKKHQQQPCSGRLCVSFLGISPGDSFSSVKAMLTAIAGYPDEL
ncbi:hypothetical protein BJ508DRAFT_307286 [Ascobolus immersus RN42]|uniref:Uncharacterized protein n=1 Tax=Ascobolus immersus RN42 TaxID=1160509 RepID=A0A3N4I5B1_ASCIM|nr:hypothetical protein BJ508DRAFT_307286 [Ascobolus immersus RN42]